MMSMGTFFSNLLGKESLESAIDTSRSVDELIERLRRLGKPVRDFPFAWAGALANEGRVEEAISVLDDLMNDWNEGQKGSSATIEDLACLEWMRGGRCEASALIERRWAAIMDGQRAWFGDCGAKLFALRVYFASRTGDTQTAQAQLAQSAEYFGHVPVGGWRPFASFAMGRISTDDLFRALLGASSISDVRKSVWRSGGMVSRAHTALLLVAGLRFLDADDGGAWRLMAGTHQIAYSFCDVLAALVRSELDGRTRVSDR